jgi:hypothetical protein
LKFREARNKMEKASARLAFGAKLSHMGRSLPRLSSAPRQPASSKRTPLVRHPGHPRNAFGRGSPRPSDLTKTPRANFSRLRIPTARSQRIFGRTRPRVNVSPARRVRARAPASPPPSLLAFTCRFNIRQCTSASDRISLGVFEGLPRVHPPFF